MNKKTITEKLILFIQEWGLILFVFVIGLWWVVLKPMGPGLRLVIGDLGDARFNNYILEHFYRWLTQQNIDYWSPAIFYPYPYALAFSDNLLGSAPFYALLRLLGWGIFDAFQGWFVIGFVLNYFAAAYVLKRYHLRPIAISFGAFFFTFGLPMLSQEGHPQLIYRFCIPLVCYAISEFVETPRLKKIVEAAFWFTWQFSLSIYLGVFTFLLLTVLILIIPWTIHGLTLKDRATFWFAKIAEAWKVDTNQQKIMWFSGILFLMVALIALLNPYYQVTEVYHATRAWEEDAFLPSIQHYFLSVNSTLWQSISLRIGQGGGGNEYQLFSGMTITLLFIIGLLQPKKAWNIQKRLYLFVFLFLFGLTLSINGFTLYKWLFELPGINSIRVVTRIILVMMWPLAVYTSFSLSSISMQLSKKIITKTIPVFLTVALLVESGLYSHSTYSKTDAEARLSALRQRIPFTVPEAPILFIKDDGNNQTWVLSALDAMFVAQELGWPLFGGYTGWIPPGFGGTAQCSQLPKRILVVADTMEMSKSKTKRFYEKFMNRVVPIGFTDCDPSWWEKMPAYKDLP